MPTPVHSTASRRGSREMSRMRSCSACPESREDRSRSITPTKSEAAESRTSPASSSGVSRRFLMGIPPRTLVKTNYRAKKMSGSSAGLMPAGCSLWMMIRLSERREMRAGSVARPLTKCSLSNLTRFVNGKVPGIPAQNRAVSPDGCTEVQTVSHWVFVGWTSRKGVKQQCCCHNEVDGVTRAGYA